MAMAYAQAQPTKLPDGNLFPPAIAFARLPFKGFATEKESRADVPKHESDPKVLEIIEAWTRFGLDLTCKLQMHSDYIYHAYETAQRAVSGIHCTTEELERFVTWSPIFASEEHFEKKLGFFLSALINAGADDRYTVWTDKLKERIDYLGVHNKKKAIIIHGSVGREAGQFMEGGSLTIHGSAGPLTGYNMYGGDLTVCGDVDQSAGRYKEGGNLYITGSVGDEAGRGMKGGTLVIQGNAGKRAGIVMEGGIVHIHGNTGDYPGNGMRGGTITIDGMVTSGIETIGFQMTEGRIYVPRLGLTIIDGVRRCD